MKVLWWLKSALTKMRAIVDMYEPVGCELDYKFTLPNIWVRKDARLKTSSEIFE